MSTALPIHHEQVEELAFSPPPYKFNVDEFDLMGTAGIFGEDDRVELIEGEILQMSPIGIPHMSIVNRLTMLLAQTVGKSAIVSVQNPIVVNRYNQPQPDLVVLKYRDDYYDKARPLVDEILLVIEVADSSVHYDRTRKKSIYAANGIMEFWVVNLGRGHVEQYSNPTAGDYRDVNVLKRGQQIRLTALPEIQFEIVDILGRGEADTE